MEKLHMQYDVIMNLDFYVFENILNSYEKILKERKDDEEEEMKKQGYDENSFNAQNMMNQVQKNMPKIPQINIPKF